MLEGNGEIRRSPHVLERWTSYESRLSVFRYLIIPTLGVGLALVIGGMLIVVSGHDPLTSYQALFNGSFGTLYATTFTLQRSVPLLITATGIVLALRGGVLNLGAEGQIYFGALGATWSATTWLGSFPVFLQAPIALLVGTLLGAVWGSIPGLLKAYRQVNEIVVGIMMNFIAILLISYFVQGPLALPNATYPQSYRIPETAMLPKIVAGTQLSSSFIIAIFVVLVVAIVLRWGVLGWRMRIVGYNPNAARYVGINPQQTIVLAMIVSGGLSGLAGGLEILGSQGVLVDNFSPGYGFEALAVALLAQLNPIGVIPSAIFFSGLRTGSQSLQRNAGVPASLAFVIQSLAVLSVIAFSGGAFRSYLRQYFLRRSAQHTDPS